MKVNHSLRQLLTSQTRYKLLNLFFGKPQELYYVRELVRLTGEEINSVRRELENLKNIHLLSFETRGNRLYYWANPDHHLYPHLVLLANQHLGLGQSLLENKSKIGSLKLAMFSQKYLHNQTTGGIDLILVGDLSLKSVDSLIKEEEKIRGVEINYMVMDRNEFNIRKLKRDPILIDFLFSFPAIIIGDPYLL